MAKINVNINQHDLTINLPDEAGDVLDCKTVREEENLLIFEVLTGRTWEIFRIAVQFPHWEWTGNWVDPMVSRELKISVVKRR